MGLPLAHGSNVVPSGLLLSSLTRLTGSLTIIIIERRDFGGIMSNDCKDPLQTQNKTV